jgi:hypothetical protein
MKSDSNYPNWFLWLWEHGFSIFTLLGLVALVVVLILVRKLDDRLSGIEDQLTQPPPRNYEPPNLDDYATADLPPESIVVEQLVYVPAYSHVYYRSGRPYPLESTLSIRNTDLSRPLYVRSVRYYDTQGKLAKTLVDRLIRLAPLETLEFVIAVHDSTGGSGANFIVDWLATDAISEPVIEAIMIGAAGAQAISLRSSGTNIKTPPSTE